MVQEEKPKKKNKLLVILIVVLVLCAVGFGAYKFFFKGGNSTKGDLVVITLKDSNGSSKTISVDSEGTFDSLPTPVREGYTFDGWYTKEVGGAVVTASTTYKTVDVTTLYAHWTAVKSKLTVSGWVMTTDKESTINIYINDQIQHITELKRTERPDVINAITNYGTASQNPKPGYNFNVDISALAGGKHIIKIEVYHLIHLPIQYQNLISILRISLKIDVK